MPPATTEKPETKTAIPERGVWWYGCLPASEPIEHKKLTRDKDETTGDFFKVESVHPADMWLRNSRERLWVGKCRWYQGIAVTGLSFTAFSEMVEHDAKVYGEGYGVGYPGHVALLTRKTKGQRPGVEEVVRAAWRTVVRFANGIEDIMSLRHEGLQKVRIVDLDMDRRPTGMSDQEWAIKHIPPQESLDFDANTDIPVAHFVYLVPLAADLKIAASANGELDLAYCVSLLPCQRINRMFFENPPKSLAEMFPQPKAGA